MGISNQHRTSDSSFSAFQSSCMTVMFREWNNLEYHGMHSTRVPAASPQPQPQPTLSFPLPEPHHKKQSFMQPSMASFQTIPASSSPS